jgi:hypothetical protein
MNNIVGLVVVYGINQALLILDAFLSLTHTNQVFDTEDLRSKVH